MDYEKAYKEALERARNLHKDAIDMEESLLAKQCEIIFPELEESEDEKIRRELIAYFRNNSVTIKWSGLDVKKVIEWLEKQGQTFTKKDVDDAYLKGLCDAKHELEKQGEQKPQGKTAIEALKEVEVNNANCATPKIKPKFKANDWIINPETGNVLQIKIELLK